MSADSFLALQTAIAAVIANAGADHMLTASQIIDDFLDPEVDAAEKRGAVKALARIDDDLLSYRDALRESGTDMRWALGVEEAAGEVRAFAAKVASGEVTL